MVGGALTWVVSNPAAMLAQQTTTVFPTASQAVTSSPNPNTLTPLPPSAEEPTSTVAPDIGASQTQSVRETLSADIMSVAATLTAQPPAATSVPGPTAGIIEDNYVRHSGSLLGVDTLNGWGGVINGLPVGVWAGAVVGDPEQGLLYLMLNYTYEEPFPTENKHGALRITAEQNNRLSIVATDGTIFYFDVPARRYVASLDEIASTATPYPTLTPHAPPSPIPTPTVFQYPAPPTPTLESTVSPP